MNCNKNCTSICECECCKQDKCGCVAKELQPGFISTVWCEKHGPKFDTPSEKPEKYPNYMKDATPVDVGFIAKDKLEQGIYTCKVHDWYEAPEGYLMNFCTAICKKCGKGKHISESIPPTDTLKDEVKHNNIIPGETHSCEKEKCTPKSWDLREKIKHQIEIEFDSNHGRFSETFVDAIIDLLATQKKELINKVTDMLIMSLPPDAENLDLTTPDQAKKVLRSFLKELDSLT